MRVLVINCSPVKTGATAKVVEIVSKELKSKNDVKSICIDDYDINFCKGCRMCHKTAKCFQQDDLLKVMDEFEWASKIVFVSPSYWADIPGQFKSFIDRCTPFCNTHEPHAKLTGLKKAYTIALRTGPSMKELERVISSIEHFCSHLEIESVSRLGLCSIEYKEDLEKRKNEIIDFCNIINE